jgi:hypothetical protein
MKHSGILLFAPAMLASAWLAGCATAPQGPVAEVAEAKALVAQADAAGAGEFAAGPLTSARNNLQSAEQLAEKGKSNDAGRAAMRSTADAKLALAVTDRAKAQQAAKDSDASIEALRTETRRN